MKYCTHLLAAALLAAGAAAHAAPFATTYHGTIGTSAIPGINAGEPYSITYIMDNQGSSANGQTWTGTDLTCALLRFNTGATASLMVDLVARPPEYLSRQIQTSTTGTMTDIFGRINVAPIQAGHYSATGLSLEPLGPGIALTLRSTLRTVLHVGGGNTPYRTTTDASNGVNLTPGGWSSPVAVTGPCDDTPLAPQPPPPGSPTGATAQAGNGRVTVSWQPPAGSAAPLSYTAYTISYHIPASCTVNHPATSCTVTGLNNDAPYTFAVTSAAPGSRPSPPSNQVTATPRAHLNPGPGDVQAVPALGLPALALLGASAAGLGALRLHRRS